MNLKKMILLVVLNTLILLSPLNVSERSIVVVVAKGLLVSDPQLDEMMKSERFVEWRLIRGEFEYEDIKDASLIMFVKVNPAANLSQGEIKALVRWFKEGSKILWLAGDGDYGEGCLRQNDVNKVLESIGSALRIEHSSVRDPISNAGTPRRVLARPCKSSWMSILSKDVKNALFHNPGPIIALINSTYVRLEEKTPPNVLKVMCSSDYSSVADLNPPPPQAHVIGERGPLVLMAVEYIENAESIVVLTGSAPFNHFTGMYMPKISNPEIYSSLDEQGDILVRNLLLIGTNPDLLVSLMKTRLRLLSNEKKLSYLRERTSELLEKIDRMVLELKAREEEIDNLKTNLQKTVLELRNLRIRLNRLLNENNVLKIFIIVLVVIGFLLGLASGRIKFKK